MPEETKAAEAATDSEAKATETIKVEEPKIDYKAELGRMKSRYDKLQEATGRIQRGKYGKGEAESTEGEQSIEDLVTQKTEEKINEFRRESSQSTVEEIISSLTGDKDEQELIRFIYDKELHPTGYDRSEIEHDLKRAFLLANADRFEAEASRKAEATIRQNMAQEKAVLDASKGANIEVGREPPVPQEQEPMSDKDRKWLEVLEEHQRMYGYKK
jgi:hypothetical protein